jgi:hypothetical protein
MLLAVFTGHDAPLAIALIIAILMIGAAVTVVLVSLVERKDRVEAIHACAEVLTRLLPWPCRNRASGQCDPMEREKRPR